MSRYGVDKLLREVMVSDDARDKFRADARTFIEGRDLSPVEREAILAGEYPALYDAGAHPFLLNMFAMRLWPRAEIAKHRMAYIASLQGHGHPDFST
jgi:hypothetical protein